MHSLAIWLKKINSKNQQQQQKSQHLQVIKNSSTKFLK